MNIKFNKKYLTKNELIYIEDSLKNEQLSGDGLYTKKCIKFLQKKFSFVNLLLTTSGTHSLELAALLVNIKKGDEVIVPSFTFPSTANAFLLRGAKIVFCDSSIYNPNIDIKNIENLITDRTKAIVPVHYAGIACDMDSIVKTASKNKISVIEDAAQCMNSFYKGRPLGGIGDIGCFSFHDTKNIICGEGGLININDTELFKKAEIFREKGTDRSAFFKGEIDKYGWINVGSSYLLSDVLGAFLFAQFEKIDYITKLRREKWGYYFDSLSSLNLDFEMPYVPKFSRHNGHIFYLVCDSRKTRNNLISFLKSNGVSATFHYQALHLSLFFKDKYKGNILQNAQKYSDRLIRLPLYPDLQLQEQDYIIDLIKRFYSE